MIENAVAARTFLNLDTIIGDTIYEEQLCIEQAVPVIEPEEELDIEDLRRDMTEVDNTMSMVQGIKVGDVREHEEDDDA
jgi:hypothetical protein